ncbi:MAG: putative E3 ubiquitin-protein ligase herc4, partial [Paramarteilia canceri]
ELEDLKELMPTLTKSFEYILQYDEANFDEIFSLNFSLEIKAFNRTKIVDLIENGSNIPVTVRNKSMFVELCIEYYLKKSVEAHLQQFKNGFFKVATACIP